MSVVVADPDPEDSIKKKCKRCGVTIQFFPSDIQTHDYNGDSCGFEYVSCPNCCDKIIV